jgi:hypothetical protein
VKAARVAVAPRPASVSSRCLPGVESALSTMHTYSAASKTAGFLIRGAGEYTAVIIVSEQSERPAQAARAAPRA